MLNVGDQLICKTKSEPETEYCIRATVLKKEDGLVTISRRLDFGQLPVANLTAPEERILEFYSPFDSDI